MNSILKLFFIVTFIVLYSSCSKTHTYNTKWMSFNSEDELLLELEDNFDGVNTARFSSKDNAITINIYELEGNSMEEEYSLMEETLDEMPDDLKDRFLIKKEKVPSDSYSSKYWLYYMWKANRQPIVTQSFFYCINHKGVNKCMLLDMMYDDRVSKDSIFEADFSKARKLFDSIELK